MFRETLTHAELIEFFDRRREERPDEVLETRDDPSDALCPCGMPWQNCAGMDCLAG